MGESESLYWTVGVVVFNGNEPPFSLRSHHLLTLTDVLLSLFQRVHRQKADSMQCDRYVFAHKRTTAIHLELITPESNASDWALGKFLSVDIKFFVVIVPNIYFTWLCFY